MEFLVLPLNWFKSYLSSRTQTVTINNKLSQPTLLNFGALQGTVLGPFLFILYTKPLLHSFDNTPSMEKHVINVCRSVYTEIRRISNIHHYLTGDATETLLCAFVLSKLDYCNSLLSGSPKHLLDKLQKVQNSAARLVFKARKHEHIKPLLQKLH